MHRKHKNAIFMEEISYIWPAVRIRLDFKTSIEK